MNHSNGPLYFWLALGAIGVTIFLVRAIVLWIAGWSCPGDDEESS